MQHFHWKKNNQQTDINLLDIAEFLSPRLNTWLNSAQNLTFQLQREYRKETCVSLTDVPQLFEYIIRQIYYKFQHLRREELEWSIWKLGLPKVNSRLSNLSEEDNELLQLSKFSFSDVPWFASSPSTCGLTK